MNVNTTVTNALPFKLLEHSAKSILPLNLVVRENWIWEAESPQLWKTLRQLGPPWICGIDWDRQAEDKIRLAQIGSGVVCIKRSPTTVSGCSGCEACDGQLWIHRIWQTAAENNHLTLKRKSEDNHCARLLPAYGPVQMPHITTTVSHIQTHVKNRKHRWEDEMQTD